MTLKRTLKQNPPVLDSSPTALAPFQDWPWLLQEGRDRNALLCGTKLTFLPIYLIFPTFPVLPMSLNPEADFKPATAAALPLFMMSIPCHHASWVHITQSQWQTEGSRIKGTSIMLPQPHGTPLLRPWKNEAREAQFKWICQTGFAPPIAFTYMIMG